MAANVYDKGDLVRCSGEFKDGSGTYADPNPLLFKMKDPSGVTTTYTYGTDPQLVKDGTGRYHVDVSATKVGTWYYRFEGTGTGQCAGENHFVVRATAF